MRFLKADVDIRLFTIILVMLAAFVGSNIYYQAYINNVQAEYDKKVEHLKDIEERLLLKEKSLNEISEVKNLLEKDKELLEMGYLNLQSENENLETEKTGLMEKLDSNPLSKAKCKITGNAQCLD